MSPANEFLHSASCAYLSSVEVPAGIDGHVVQKDKLARVPTDSSEVAHLLKESGRPVPVRLRQASLLQVGYDDFASQPPSVGLNHGDSGEDELGVGGFGSKDQGPPSFAASATISLSGRDPRLHPPIRQPRPTSR